MLGERRARSEMFQHHQYCHCPQADDQRKFNVKKARKTGDASCIRPGFLPRGHAREQIECTRLMQSMDEKSKRVCLVFWRDVAVRVQVRIYLFDFLTPIESCAANLNCGNGLNPKARAVESHVVYSFTSKSIQWIM
jgi:hypothetical protein